MHLVAEVKRFTCKTSTLHLPVVSPSQTTQACFLHTLCIGLIASCRTGKLNFTSKLCECTTTAQDAAGRVRGDRGDHGGGGHAGDMGGGECTRGGGAAVFPHRHPAHRTGARCRPLSSTGFTGTLSVPRSKWLRVHTVAVMLVVRYITAVSYVITSHTHIIHHLQYTNMLYLYVIIYILQYVCYVYNMANNDQH